MPVPCEAGFLTACAEIVLVICSFYPCYVLNNSTYALVSMPLIGLLMYLVHRKMFIGGLNWETTDRKLRVRTSAIIRFANRRQSP